MSAPLVAREHTRALRRAVRAQFSAHWQRSWGAVATWLIPLTFKELRPLEPENRIQVLFPACEVHFHQCPPTARAQRSEDAGE